jgi:serine/threonine protein kinase
MNDEHIDFLLSREIYLVKILGRGSFGVVYLGKLNGELVVVKAMSKHKEGEENYK